MKEKKSTFLLTYSPLPWTQCTSPSYSYTSNWFALLSEYVCVCMCVCVYVCMCVCVCVCVTSMAMDNGRAHWHILVLERRRGGGGNGAGRNCMNTLTDNFTFWRLTHLDPSTSVCLGPYLSVRTKSGLRTSYVLMDRKYPQGTTKYICGSLMPFAPLSAVRDVSRHVAILRVQRAQFILYYNTATVLGPFFQVRF